MVDRKTLRKKAKHTENKQKQFTMILGRLHGCSRQCIKFHPGCYKTEKVMVKG